MANSKETYAAMLRDPRWQKKRLEIYSRDSFTCQLCGDTTTELQVHHSRYSGLPWEADSNFLTTYCRDCHKVVEYIKLIPDSMIGIKAIKCGGNKEDNIAIIVIAKSLIDSLNCILYFQYFRSTDILEFSLSTPTRIIRLLNTELDILKQAAQNA